MLSLTVLLRSVLLTSLLVLTACGGSSGGGNDNGNQNEQPDDGSGGDGSGGDGSGGDGSGGDGSGGDGSGGDGLGGDGSGGDGSGGDGSGGDGSGGDGSGDDGSGGDGSGGDGSGGDGSGGDGSGGDGEPPVASLGIVLIGDSGSGSQGAYAVGEAVRRVCQVRRCDLVLGLGDNIYESGVSSAFDPQFEEKFELPFAPIELPFYMVLGNHDNSEFFGGDGAGNANGDFQVDYHYRRSDDESEARQTERWQMPARYYRFTEGELDGRPLVEFFAIDSNQVAGGFPDSDENYSYNNYGLVQAEWLKAAMASSTAKWKFAFAHHPYLSNGTHGNAGNYDGVPSFIAPVLAGERYKAFLEETICDKADFLFAGHDHDLQWLMPTADCGKTGFIVSGAASKQRSLERRDNNPVYYEKGDTYGFIWLEVSGDTLKGEVFEVDPNRADLGLGDLEDPQPTFVREMTQRAPVGLPENDGFTSPLTPEPGYDLNAQEGNLDPVQSQLQDGLTLLAEALPEENSAALISAIALSSAALLEVADALLSGAQNAATEQNPELAVAGSARAYQSLLFALQSLREGIPAGEGGDIPAPFDQLAAALDEVLESSGDSESGDLSQLTAPLNALVLNLHNVVDAIEEEGQVVPVVGPALSMLSELVFDVTRLIDAVGNVDSSEVGQVLVSTIDDLLANLLLKVVPIEDNAPGEVSETIGLGPQFISSGLLAVVREVTFILDGTVLSALQGLLGLLPPDLVDSLVDGLIAE
ncbi:metallophosphoesterase [Spongiibacter taiwanensis]|uniref:metallophosphoesterase n=1 Tax=Spongiibacter taiwanensis TaxID=1748242 RepID=UPI00203607DB|nr:metallophosphoesterase [Spongiibacter taiwanensis]USA44241.1 metallophosphoesterase [Spongiibacter taiwanensis]